MQSLAFESVVAGAAFRTRLSEPFTEETVKRYFELTHDQFPIHSRSGFAQHLGLRDRMVPGNLVVARAAGLAYEDGPFQKSLYVQAQKDTRFLHPLFIGERIYVVDVVVLMEDRPGKPYGRVLLERRAFNQDDLPHHVSAQDYRVLKREALDGASLI